LSSVGDVEEITVRINSGGGDVFAAQAIGNLLEQHAANVTAKIDGLCASAATIIACHCNKVVAANDSTYMIHPVKMGLYGFADAVTLQSYIDALDAIRDNIVSLYAKKTGRDKDEVGAQMDETSWWTGAQAKENGFVDELVDEEEETVTENRGGFLFVNGVGTHLLYNDTPFAFVQNSRAHGAGGFVNKKPEKRTENKEEGNMEIKTVDDLKKAYPEFVGMIEAEASEKTAAEERQRIRDIEEMSIAGSEDFVNEAKFEKPISAGEFAMQAVKRAKQAEDAQKEDYLNGREKDVKDSKMEDVAPDDVSTDEFMDAIKSVKQK
jgi:ATP-dependent protease ClpP protease subunit